MRVLSILFCVALAFGVPAQAMADRSAQEAAAPGFEEAHLRAAQRLIVASNNNNLITDWSAETLRAKFAGILQQMGDDPNNDAFLKKIVSISQQGKLLVIGMWSSFYAMEIPKDDLVALAEMYEAGMEEKKILRTRPGRKWRKAQVKTGEDRRAAITVAENKMVEAVVAEFEKTYNVRIPRK